MGIRFRLTHLIGHVLASGISEFCFKVMLATGKMKSNSFSFSFIQWLDYTNGSVLYFFQFPFFVWAKVDLEFW